MACEPIQTRPRCARASLQLVVSGPPASGKGTQCERLVAEFCVVHLSTGDMLRAAVAAGSELGRAAKSEMRVGRLVPDELVISIVLERLAQRDCLTRGWLLDGFPRTRAQADALRDAGVSPDAFVLLEVPADELVARVVGRRLDPETGKVYHLTTNPPPKPLAHRVQQRADDTAETAAARIATYDANLAAVLAAFDGLALEAGDSAGPAPAMLARIDGSRAPALVYADVREAVAARAHARWAGALGADGLTSFRDLPPELAVALPAAAATVVLIHGIGNFSYCWAELAARLTASGLRVVSYDLIGRGHSRLPAGAALDGNAHVAQLRALLTQLGLAAKPVVLIGHSMGGALAALYAEQHGGVGGAPLATTSAEAAGGASHVAGVALLAPAGLMDAALLRVARGLGALGLLAPVLRGGQEEAQAKDFVERASDGARATLRALRLQAERAPRAFVAAVGSIRAFPLYGLAATARALGAAPRLPVLVCWGELDSVVPFRANDRRWRRALEGRGCELTVQVHAGLGHGFFLEQPDATLPAIVAWALKAAAKGADGD
jgi:adenylate kinase